MANLLLGRLALVTGAGSGIGKAVAELFAKEGAIVIGAGINVDGAIKELPSYGEHMHMAHEMDVSCEASVKAMMEEVWNNYQRPPTIAVNCAGITRDGFLLKMSEKDFDDVINVNLKGTFFMTKHLCKLLIRNKVSDASIINIASIVGKTGNIGQANYTASKAGVVGLSKTIALEYASFGIRCNAVLPGFIDTAMTEKVPSKVKEQVKQMIPLKKFGEPLDIAQACLFLASDQSKYITGSSIEVTGGLAA